MQKPNQLGIREPESHSETTTSSKLDADSLAIKSELNSSSVSLELLGNIKQYLVDVERSLPSFPIARVPGGEDILWNEERMNQCVVVYKTLETILNHPKLDDCECDNGEDINQKARKFKIAMFLYIPGFDAKLTKSNESASNLQN